MPTQNRDQYVCHLRYIYLFLLLTRRYKKTTWVQDACTLYVDYGRSPSASDSVIRCYIPINKPNVLLYHQVYNGWHHNWKINWENEQYPYQPRRVYNEATPLVTYLQELCNVYRFLLVWDFLIKEPITQTCQESTVTTFLMILFNLHMNMLEFDKGAVWLNKSWSACYFSIYKTWKEIRNYYVSLNFHLSYSCHRLGVF